MPLKKNLCRLDKNMRGLIGVVVTGCGIVFGQQIGDPVLQGLVIAFGLLNLVSFVTSWCLVYQLVSISTIEHDKPNNN